MYVGCWIDLDARRFLQRTQWYTDVYINTFDSKVIFDFDASADSAIVSLVQNTVNRPYTLSYQIGAQYELIHRTLVKASYRYQEAKQRDLSGVSAGNGLEDVIRMFHIYSTRS